MMEARRKQNDIFKVMKKYICQPRILCSAKKFLKNKLKQTCFSGNTNEFLVTDLHKKEKETNKQTN